MSAYDHIKIAEYWTKKWEEDGIYRTDIHSDKKKRYLLVEFPYPSGEGLHVGHVRSYTAMDVIARASRRQGYEVLFPIGYDSFGLPAENYAIKTGIHPSITTRKNIDNFERQMKNCGFSFDWERRFETTDPQYYKWTQWIFLKLYEQGLAYKKEMPVNWCPKDKCVLANEEVVDGACERCGTLVEKRNKEQWMLAITKYAERLHKDLDETTYLEKIKIQQRNWIGLSEGSEIDFTLQAGDTSIPFTIFTTRADTIFGCTYCVLAPEHPRVKQLLDMGAVTNSQEVRLYIDEAVSKPDIDRSAEGKEKTGVKLEGVTAINPATKESVPVFIADYVLPQYGAGAIMAVPAHDERDGEFAKKYGITVKQVIAPVRYDLKNPFVKDWPTIERQMVQIILRNPKDQTYLMLKWKELPWVTFVGGGIENGESARDAALRELKEEAGISNVTFIRELSVVRSEYSANHKKQNRISYCKAVVLDMSDTTTEEAPSQEETTRYEKMWVHKNEFPSEFICSEWGIWEKELASDSVYITEDGALINSGEHNGLTSQVARNKITEALHGRVVIKSKLRDWVFARQRYWGEPIPVVYDKEGTMYPVAESELPIVLPMVDKYEPTDNGESPLATITDWVNVKGKIDATGHFVTDETGEVFRRETDTMPQWAGSSWYFMRYIDPKNETALGDPELLKAWLPVDWYNGGMEHTTLHLLYSRFWYKFLFDIGLVPTSEPYYKRTSQGMILGAGGVKMSKSLGNVVNPDQIITSSGADVLRVYEMFIGPFDQSVAWDDKAIVGVERFLDKVYKLSKQVDTKVTSSLPVVHQTISKVTEGVEAMTFNTCISQLMICANEFEKRGTVSASDFDTFIKLLAPFAPFLAEELWKERGYTESVHISSWPVADQTLLVEKEVTLAIQISGKLRGTITVARDVDENTVLFEVKNLEIYTKYVGENVPKKVIFVPNKLINIVI